MITDYTVLRITKELTAVRRRLQEEFYWRYLSTTTITQNEIKSL